MAYNDVPDGDTLAPGRYFIDGMPVRVSLTLPTGWEHSGPGGPLGVGLGKPESSSRAEVLLAFWASVGWVYDDACDLSTLYEVGPSVDDLVDALVATSSVEATTPTEVSIGGFTGQHLTLRRAVECPVDYYGLWQSPDGSGGRIDHGQGDPPLDEIWILDVDGTRMVIGIHSYASAAAADLAEAREVVDSITFDRLD